MDEAERTMGCLSLIWSAAGEDSTIASIIASQNLITMRTSGMGLTLLEKPATALAG